MEIELRELMDRSEMLSHIFLGCIPAEDLLAIKEEFIGDKDFKKESATSCNENEKQEANDPYCIDCKIEIEAN